MAELIYHIKIRCLSKTTIIHATDNRHKTAKLNATLLFNNEMWVNLSGYMHSKNNRYSAVNGTLMHYTPLHDVKVGVGCAECN